MPLDMIQRLTGHTNIAQTQEDISSERMKEMKIETEGVVALLAQRENTESGQHRHSWPKGKIRKVSGRKWFSADLCVGSCPSVDPVLL